MAHAQPVNPSSVSIVIIDYDAGNLRNVQKAIHRLGYQSAITSKRVEDVRGADILILPGVGAFRDGMRALGRLGLDDAIRQEVGEKQKPLLGICLGMQLLAVEGEEDGLAAGLGLLPMQIERLRSESSGLRVPHIGWNAVRPSAASVLFRGLPAQADFYFVHSYHAVCAAAEIVVGTCEYGQEVVAAVERGNILATQFHPEKSQRYGLQVLENFLAYASKRAVERASAPC